MINMFIRSYLDNSAILEWIIDSRPNSYELNYSINGSAPWTHIADLDKMTTTFVLGPQHVDLNMGEIYVQLRPIYSDSELTDANTAVLLLALVGATSSPSLAIAVDANGNAKKLKTDSGGNLMVSAITLDAAGMGDASAALQGTQLTALQSLMAKQDATILAVESVNTSLSSVRLASTQISDLKNVTIANTPTDYPDISVLNAVDAMTSVVAKDTTLTSVISAVNALQVPFDFDFNGALNVSLTNTPVDYPSVGTEAKLIDTNVTLAAVQSILTSSNSTLTGIDTTLDLIEANTENTVSGLSDITTVSIPGLQTALLDIHTTNSTIESTVAKDNTLLAISDKVDLLAKTTDIPITNLAVDVNVQEFPADYPSAQTHTDLDSILTSINRLDTSDVTITSSLPSGANAIGKVEVLNALLPADAATDSTLIDIKLAIASLYDEIDSTSVGAIKYSLSNLLDTVLEIHTKMVEDSNPEPLYHDTMTITPNSMSTTGSIGNLSRRPINLGVAFSGSYAVSLRLLTSEDGISFFPVKGYYGVIMEGNVYNTISAPTTLKFIQVQLINTSSSSVISDLQLTITNEAR